jgi:phosphoserine phosphatase
VAAAAAAATARQTTTSRSDPGSSTLGSWELACFDLDGTLITGTSISQFFADRLGYGEELAVLERRYAAGETSNADIADLTCSRFAGCTLEWAAAELADVPCIRGIEPTVAHLAARGIPSLLCTVTWRFAAEVLRERYGFAAACGTELAEEPAGVLSGRVSRYFDEHDKRRFVEDYCAGAGIALERCIAVGDSRSDIPLFSAVGFSIALNATAAAREAATTALDTGDLTHILALVPDRPAR